MTRWSRWLGGLAGIALLALLAGWALLHELYPFLAITTRVPASILVIDGWLPTFDLALAADEFRHGGYAQVLIVRAAYGFEALDHDPGNVQVVTQVLRRFGVPADRIAATVFDGVKKDRTRAAAQAVRAWLEAHGHSRDALELYTLGPHARRTRLVYCRALPGRAIGVIAAEDPAYDRDRWWQYTDGIREVPFEGLAYLYTRL